MIWTETEPGPERSGAAAGLPRALHRTKLYVGGLTVGEERDPGERVRQTRVVCGDQTPGLVHVTPQLKGVFLWRNRETPFNSNDKVTGSSSRLPLTCARQVRRQAAVLRRGWSEPRRQVVQHVGGVRTGAEPEEHIQLGLNHQPRGAFPRRLRTQTHIQQKAPPHRRRSDLLAHLQKQSQDLAAEDSPRLSVAGEQQVPGSNAGVRHALVVA